MANPTHQPWRERSMKRVVTVLVILFGLLAFAPVAAAASPRENFDNAGFDAFGSQCGQQTCTDTNFFADRQTTASGEVSSFACVDQFTYNIRTGRGTDVGGCLDGVDFTVAGDLSSASLPATQFEVCQRNNCRTITVSANLTATGSSATFRSRYTERDGTCTFTYSDSGQSRSASGSVTFDGSVVAVDGSIRSGKTTVASKCK